MFRAILPRLQQWSRDPATRLVLVTGSGNRGLAAGGDIKTLRQMVLHPDIDSPSNFIYHEYRVNQFLHHLNVPCVAIMNGIVMGGGAGMSVNGRYRVVTETTRFAMPEALIGWYPDVGATHFLSHTPGRIGEYAAMTGEHLGGADCMHAGIGTHFVPSDRVAALIDAILGMPEPSHKSVQQLLQHFSTPPPDSRLAGERRAIDHCFAADTAEEIVARIKAWPDAAWSGRVLQRLDQLSPISVKVALALQRQGRLGDLDDALHLEYRTGVRFGLLEPYRSNFAAGVQARLIDRTTQPAWAPASLAEVSDRLVAAAMEPLQTNLNVKELVFADP